MDRDTLAVAFVGDRVGEACLGGPCWAFGPEASAAISALDDSARFEVWLGPNTAARPAADIDRQGRNSRPPGPLRRIAQEARK